MSEIDVPTIQRTLVATKRREQQARERPAAAGASAEERFREGVASRRKVFDLLSGITAPSTPQRILLDTPFLIWAFRNYDKPTNMLVDSHVEPGNSSAQIGYWYEDGGIFLEEAEVNFYFMWRNDTSADAVVNVASLLFVKGNVRLLARGGWIPSFGLWEVGTEGNVETWLSARLTLLEWWNQPPTQPLQQASQSRDVTHLRAEGSWVPISAFNNESVDVADSFHVNYDSFLVPAESVAIFEVSLRIGVDGRDGNIKVDFDDPFGLILCPHVELQVLNGTGAATVEAVA
jgi:hypothetical protein